MGLMWLIIILLSIGHLFGFYLTWGDGNLRGEETASNPSPQMSRGPGCVLVLTLHQASSCAPAPGTVASRQQRAGAGVLRESRPSWPEATPVCPGSLWLHPPGSLPLCSLSPGPRGQPRIRGRAAGQAHGPAGQEATSTQRLGSPAQGSLESLTSFLREACGACHCGSPKGLRRRGPVTGAHSLLGRVQPLGRPAWYPPFPSHAPRQRPGLAGPTHAPHRAPRDDLPPEGQGVVFDGSGHTNLGKHPSAHCPVTQPGGHKQVSSALSASAQPLPQTGLCPPGASSGTLISGAILECRLGPHTSKTPFSPCVSPRVCHYCNRRMKNPKGRSCRPPREGGVDILVKSPAPGQSARL